jgi:hypothetical protein
MAEHVVAGHLTLETVLYPLADIASTWGRLSHAHGRKLISVP